MRGEVKECEFREVGRVPFMYSNEGHGEWVRFEQDMIGEF